MNDWRPICYIKRFVEVGSLVQMKKNSEGFYSMIYRHGNNFGHLTQMPGINCCSPTHKMIIGKAQGVSQ